MTGGTHLRGLARSVGLPAAAVAVGVLGALIGSVSGCQQGRGARVPDDARAPFVSTNPFAPRTVRVFPLTRFDRNSAGEPVLVLHVEMRDALGDAVKGAGVMRVELYRRYTAAATPDTVWSVDLRDLSLNARLYDPATRTYAIPLGGLPPWTAVLARSGPPDASAAAGSPPTVQVLLNVVGRDVDDLGGADPAEALLKHRAPIE